MTRTGHIARIVKCLRHNTSGVAMVEFALSVPFLLTFGLWGIETANLAMTNMRVAQMAVQIADNASRVGDTTSLEYRKVYESDINDIFAGANIQTKKMKFFDNGRAIISSLEVSSSGNQYIHWQRCKGMSHVSSAYGNEGTVLSVGMGPTGEEVSAPPDEAVIFVELIYTYQPLVTNFFVNTTTIKSSSSFIVRDKRDLTQIYQRVAASPDPVSNCNTYSSYP